LAGSERLRLIPLVILGDDASRKFVHASLTGKWAIREVLMLVDTGAQKTVIDEVLAKELAVKYEQDVQLAGITSTVRTWMGRLPRLRLGTEEISNLQVVVSPRPGRLLLGMDVLERLALSVTPRSLQRASL
jgi:predicted aspartyl protease